MNRSVLKTHPAIILVRPLIVLTLVRLVLSFMFLLRHLISTCFLFSSSSLSLRRQRRASQTMVRIDSPPSRRSIAAIDVLRAMPRPYRTPPHRTLFVPGIINNRSWLTLDRWRVIDQHPDGATSRRPPTLPRPFLQTTSCHGFRHPPVYSEHCVPSFRPSDYQQGDKDRRVVSAGGCECNLHPNPEPNFGQGFICMSVEKKSGLRVSLRGICCHRCPI